MVLGTNIAASRSKMSIQKIVPICLGEQDTS